MRMRRFGMMRRGRRRARLPSYAKVIIEEGQEIQIDYDMGDVQRRSFYRYLTEAVGVPAASLDSGDYKRNIWATPRSLRVGAV